MRLREHLSEVLHEIGEPMIRLARVESHGPGAYDWCLFAVLTAYWTRGVNAMHYGAS